MLRVKLLDPGAKAPVCANPGEDLGYDLFALEGVALRPGEVTRVRTGIAVEFDVRMPVPSKLQPGSFVAQRVPYGFLIRDRSSMAANGITVSGGVIDAGYRGEVVVLLTFNPKEGMRYILAGEKIAQMFPVAVVTRNGVEVVDELGEGQRGEAGFGSTGK